MITFIIKLRIIIPFSCESTLRTRGWISIRQSNRLFKTLRPGTHKLIIGPEAHHSKALCTLAQKNVKNT